MEFRKKGVSDIFRGAVVFGVILAVWEWSVRSGYILRLALPQPTGVINAALSLLVSPSFLRNWLSTLGTWSSALFGGLLVGLLAGFAAGSSERVGRFVLPPFGYFRSIPPIALFPVALIAVGAGVMSIGLVSGIAAALYVFPGTVEATRDTTRRFRDLARVTGANSKQFLFFFIAPGAALHVLAASRVAATVAFAVCVAGEMIIGGNKGVGAAILDLSERYRLEESYAYILFTGLVGLGIDVMFSQTRLLPWIENGRANRR